MPPDFGGAGLEPLPFSPPPRNGGDGGDGGKLSHDEPFPPPPAAPSSPPSPSKPFLSKVSWSKLSKKPPPLRVSSSSSSAKASTLAAARLTALRTSSVAATPAATPAATVSPPRIQVTFLCFLVAVPETTAVMDSAREPTAREGGGGR